MRHVIRIEGINPSPWTSPDLGTIRQGKRVIPTSSKKPELRAYQSAIHEALEAEWHEPVIISPVKLTFYFWHRIEKYTNAGGRLVRKHRVDATNLQKATEDALQKIVIKNDNQVLSVHSVLVEEGDDVEPCIIIVVEGEDTAEADRVRGENLRER